MMTIFEEEKHAFKEFFQSASDDKVLKRDHDELDNADRTGLEELLYSNFPVCDERGAATLVYVCYDLRVYADDGEELQLSELGDSSFFRKERPADAPEDFTSSCDLVVTLRNVIWNDSEEGQDRSVQDIIEQDVNFGSLPQMTVNGTFIHEGIEKKHAGEGLAADRLEQLYDVAFFGMESAIVANMNKIDCKTALPFDLVECWPLRVKTEEFFEELVPVLVN